MIWNVLTGAASDSASASKGGDWPSMLPLLLIIGMMIVFMVFNRRSQKKKQQELAATLDAIQPGNKVKTIGGICGIVVEVCPEDNTFVLETGSETSGKSYLKFDKQAVYQTDAVAKKEEKVEAPAVEAFEEKAEEVSEEKTEE